MRDRVEEQRTLKKAYDEFDASVLVREPDLFDEIYVGLRTFIPGWIMAMFILVGAMVIGVAVFKKQIRVGLEILTSLIKSGEKDG